MNQRGATTAYFLLFTLVVLGFLVFATDFGRFYLIQGELQTAADAAALAAATSLNGMTTAVDNAGQQIEASFDTFTGNDNRFNLRLNQLGPNTASNLLTTTSFDYYATLQDALNDVNGAQAAAIDWGSGFYAKYVRVRITAQAPALFLPLLNGAVVGPTVAANAVAGLSAPICSACGIDAIAVQDFSAGEDSVNYGFTPGEFYTLFVARSQRTAGAVTPQPLAGAPTVIPYIVMNHVPRGPSDLDSDGTLFEFGAGGLATGSGLTIPANVAVDSAETAYAVTGTNSIGQDVLCGLNTRFGVAPSDTPNCNNLGGGQFASLAPLYTTDTDDGSAEYAAGAGLQDYATEYNGNLRRILTVAIVDTTDALTVLNFRQFLLEMSPPGGTVTTGLNTLNNTGAFRAQYIGSPVAIRCGNFGGMCSATSGIGRTVLH